MSHSRSTPRSTRTSTTNTATVSSRNPTSATTPPSRLRRGIQRRPGADSARPLRALDAATATPAGFLTRGGGRRPAATRPPRAAGPRDGANAISLDAAYRPYADPRGDARGRRRRRRASRRERRGAGARGAPPGTDRLLLPDARLDVRGRGRGAGDDAAGLAGKRALRGPLSAGAWLYRIATNVCFDALRDSQRRP